MSYLTPHLETILLVAASIYPVGFCANVTALMNGPRSLLGQSQARGQSLSSDLLGFVMGYGIILLVMAMVRPQQLLALTVPSSVSLLLLAPLVGLACIFLEYLVGVLLLFLRTGKLTTRMAVHSIYSAVSHIAITDILSILALVIGEELILRQFLYNLLTTEFALTLRIVVLLCTLVYAINHLSFGFPSVIAKLPSGLIYVLLFYVSGLSVVVVIVAHATQNLALLALGSITRKGMTAAGRGGEK